MADRRDKIRIAPPLRFPRTLGDPSEPMPPVVPIEVTLVPGDAVLDAVIDVIDLARRENVELYGIMLGTVAYFSLQEHMRHKLQAMFGYAGGETHFTLDGVRLFMDPTRDLGDAVPIYGEAAAVHLYALRVQGDRTTSDRASSGGTGK